MAGAFVAVADDSTAVFWNPAGLVSGQPVGGNFEWGQFQFGNRDAVPNPGPFEGKSTLWSLGSWPVGLSMGTFQQTVLVPDISGSPSAFNTRTSYLGVTVLQTLVENVVIGSTLESGRGRTDRALAVGGTVEEALDHGSDLEGDKDDDFDFDLGLMANLNPLRIGWTVRNMLEPKFGHVAENEITLKRRARLGVAFIAAAGLTLAMDFDLDTAELENGPSRIIAFGGEAKLGPRMAVRSGLRWSTTGDRRLVGAVGGSFMIRPRLWIDGHFSQGGTDELRAFSLAMRAGM